MCDLRGVSLLFEWCSGLRPSPFFKLIRQAFRPQACEILTDELQILVPRLFVPLNLKVTLVIFYQGPPTPGDSILAVSLRCPCGVLAESVRRNFMWRDPRGAIFSPHWSFCFVLAARFYRFDIHF